MTDHAGIDPQRWSSMDPLVRARFHDMGNHITRLEGVITGLSMRVPERPEIVPVLQEKVTQLESGHKELRTIVKSIDDKLDSLTIRVVGGTTILTVLGSLAVNLLTK